MSECFIEQLPLKILAVCSLTNLPCKFASYLGTIITRMTYGSETPEKSKQFVIDAERLVQTLTDSASIPGKHYITAFPFLKHVPEWVPGAGFQRTFREHRDLTWKTLKEPFEAVRTRLVSLQGFNRGCCQYLR